MPTSPTAARGAKVSRFDFERALRDSELPPTARHVALTLATWADAATGLIPARYTPSLSTLAAASGLDRSTVARQLVLLEAEHWVARQPPDPARARAEKARTRYRLTLPASRTVPLADTGSSRTVQPALVAQDHMASRTVRHKPNMPTNSQTREETKPMTKTDELLARIADQLDVADPATLIDTWRNHRAKIGRPIDSPTAYLTGLDDDVLREQLAPHKPGPPTRPRCTRCNGDTWLYDDDGNALGKCDHQDGPAALTATASEVSGTS